MTRRILALSFVAALAIAGCKKQTGQVSVVKTASYPIITITGPQYISIAVGGVFTPPNATAYDTFYKERPTVVKDLGGLDNTTPGLYTVVYSAKNSNGFIGTAVVYVAVTDVTDTLDLSGLYWRSSDDQRPANISKLAKGLFMTDNVGGVDTGTQKEFIVPAVFAVTSLSTVDFGSQPTSAGTLTTTNGMLSFTPDTTISYIITAPSSTFSGVLRQFVKQP
ncbi:MAG: Bacterial Ig-like domain (group 3) [Flavipsychrobacter sp.]|jgi:hypothetical protein|nr:Bacterial Ig-like domain (group 3) [Flavipsychrobacter sp.]